MRKFSKNEAYEKADRFRLFGLTQPYEVEALKAYCQKNQLADTEVSYVQQGKCVVNIKPLITTNLSFCSALAIGVGNTNILAHVDSSTRARAIVNEVKKSFNLPLKDDNIKIKLYLGNYSSIKYEVVKALYDLGILENFMNLKTVQSCVKKYIAIKIFLHAELPHINGFDLLELYINKNPEIQWVNKFLEMTEIKNKDDIQVCYEILDIMKDDPEFLKLLNSDVIFSQPEDIISTDDLTKDTSEHCALSSIQDYFPNKEFLTKKIPFHSHLKFDICRFSEEYEETCIVDNLGSRPSSALEWRFNR